jgi:hypothetical protein
MKMDRKMLSQFPMRVVGFQREGASESDKEPSANIDKDTLDEV